MGDCFVLAAVGSLMQGPDANRNGGMALLISEGLGET